MEDYSPFDREQIVHMEIWRQEASRLHPDQFKHLVRTWNTKVNGMERVRERDDIKEIPSKLPYRSTQDPLIISIDGLFWTMLKDRQVGVML